ncbi:MAG: CBS domain-containing protein [Streptosporangiaceae bacterium]
MYDYAAGKADWLAAGLPFEGTARLAGLFTPRQVATASEDTPAREALRRLRAAGFGPVVVLNQAGVVMGAVHRDQLEAAAAGTEAGALMRFGVSTVRREHGSAE